MSHHDDGWLLLVVGHEPRKLLLANRIMKLLFSRLTIFANYLALIDQVVVPELVLGLRIHLHVLLCLDKGLQGHLLIPNF